MAHDVVYIRLLGKNLSLISNSASPMILGVHTQEIKVA